MNDSQKIELYETVINHLFLKLKGQDGTFLRNKKEIDIINKSKLLLDFAKKSNDFVFDNVYAYIFQDTKSIYIGRTIDLVARDKQHRLDKDSSVFKFANINSVKIPPMTILERNISLEDGIKKEDYYCNVARKSGWNLINVAKTGISIAVGKSKQRWNYEKCYSEAIKYDKVGDFKKFCPNAYSYAIKNGIIQDFYWLKGRVLNVKRVRSYTECYEVAKKYELLNDFYKKDKRIFRYAKTRGWLKDYSWLKKEKEHKKKVAQYTIDGVLVRIFDSIYQASKITKFSYNGIYACYNQKRKEYRGFIWKPIV